MRDAELFLAWIGFYLFIGIYLILIGGVIYYWALEVIEYIKFEEKKHD